MSDSQLDKDVSLLRGNLTEWPYRNGRDLSIDEKEALDRILSGFEFAKKHEGDLQ